MTKHNCLPQQNDKMCKGRAVDNTYLDYSKAFSTLSRCILVSKLEHCSADGQTARWVSIWLEVPWEPTLRPRPLNVFIGGLKEKTDHNFVRLAEGIKFRHKRQ